MANLKFKLEGRDGGCDFSDFSNFASDIAEVLRRMYRSRNPGQSKLPRFSISDLELGSAICEVSAADAGSQAINDMINTILSVKERQRPSVRVTSDDVRALRRLTDPLFSNTSSIEIQNIAIDQEFKDGCNWLIDSVPPSKGQAIGRLDAMNVHLHQFFRLYPEGQDRGAECYFDNSLYPQVHGAMRRRVRVEGLIYRDPDGVGIDRIRELRSIEVLPEDKDLPPFSELFGLFQDCPVDLGGGWDE